MIESLQNDRVKRVRQLQRQAKARRQSRRLVLDGVRLVVDAVETGARPDFVCYTLARHTPGARVDDVIASLDAAGVPCLPVTDAVMQHMSDTETPQGLLGVFPWPDLPLPEVPTLVLAADGWRDPGNLGTLLRTAAAAGVDLVALLPGTVDPFNPKVLRAGMGAHFRVALRHFDWDDLRGHYPALRVWVADAGAAMSHYAVDWSQPALIVVGGEAHGPGDAVRSGPHTAIHIPMVSGAESLNAATAAAVLIYAARRDFFGG